jgi:hypothetical protein
VTKPLLRLLVLACALAAITVAPSAASAAAPCWKTLLLVWADGHIDKVYAIPCYHQALAHLPTDISTYSSARSDIERALQQAITKREKPNTVIPRTTTTTRTLPNGTKTTVTTTVASPGKKKPKGFAGAIGRLNPSSPDAFPLPLVILGALAILLVLAGLGGMLYRRYGSGPPGPAAP